MQINSKQIPPGVESFLLELLKTAVSNVVKRVKENQKAGEMMRLLSQYATEDEKEGFSNLIKRCHDRHNSTI